MMFRTKLMIGAIGWLAIVSLWGWRFHTIDSTDRLAYQKLMANSDKTQEPISKQNQQQRFHVVKDLFFAELPCRLQCRINSDSSELILNQQGHRMEMMECFKNVTCYIQEELLYELPDGRLVKKDENGKFFIQGSDPQKIDVWLDPRFESQLKPKQWVRYLKAEKAVYHYQSKELVADSVDVYRYLIPGHALVQTMNGLKPMIEGKADHVQLSLSKNRHVFHAQGFRARIPTAETSSCN